MRLLALDAAVGWCSAAVMENGAIVATRAQQAAHGQAEILPLLVKELLADDARLDAIGVTTGPGSFTGIRAALSLAHGLAMGGAAKMVGVTVGEALRQAHRPHASWVALRASRDRMFLDRAGAFELFGHDDLPPEGPGGDVCVTGDAAALVQNFYLQRNLSVTILDDYQPLADAVAALTSEKLHQVDTIFTSSMPLYVDAPAIKQNSLRPPPAIAGAD